MFTDCLPNAGELLPLVVDALLHLRLGLVDHGPDLRLGLLEEAVQHVAELAELLADVVTSAARVVATRRGGRAG